MEKIRVRSKSNEEKLEELRNSRQTLLVKVRPLKKFKLLAYIILPILWPFVIYYKYNNHQLKKEIKNINKRIVTLGGFESNYQEIYK